jgi:hypothetical protein
MSQSDDSLGPTRKAMVAAMARSEDVRRSRLCVAASVPRHHGAADPIVPDFSALKTPDLLARFQQCQEARVAEYRTLEDDFKSMMITGDFALYHRAIRQTTQRFAFLSQCVRAISAALRATMNGAGLADAIERLQSHEQTKLRTTAELQVVQQAISSGSLGGDEGEPALQALRSRLREVVEAINDVMDELTCARYELAGA